MTVHPEGRMRVLSLVAMAVGLFLLGEVVYHAACGDLPARVFGMDVTGSPHPLLTSLPFALLLALAVPAHVVSVGLFLQRRRLPGRWPRIAWIAVAGSGCWLGASLLTRLLLES